MHFPLPADPDTRAQVTHAGVAWSAVGVSHAMEYVGIHSWGEAAAALATIYSALLIVEWVWKRIIKRQPPPPPTP